MELNCGTRQRRGEGAVRKFRLWLSRGAKDADGYNGGDGEFAMRDKKWPRTILAAILAVLLAVTACGPQDTDDTDTDADVPRDPQIVGLSIQDEPASLDPTKTIQLTAYQVLAHIMESLVYIGDDGAPQPWLAESWDIEDEGKTLIMHIREGRKFSDGTTVDAEAVAWSLNRHLDPEVASVNKAQVGPLETVEAVDDYTVRLEFSEPFAPIWVNLAGVWLGVLSPTAGEEEGGDFGRKPISSGPFMIKEYTPATGFVLVPNPHYENHRADVDNPGPPKIDELHIKIIPEEGTRVAALETGEIHLGDAPREELDRFKDDPGFVLTMAETNNNLSMIEVNPFKPPMDNLLVRKAIAYAVDIEQIAEAAYADVVTPNWNPLPNALLGWDPAIGEQYGYRHNPEKAKELLAEAGYVQNADGKWEDQNGEPLTIIIYSYTLQNGIRGGQTIQENLRSIGINAELEMFEVATCIAKLSEREHHINFMWWSWWDPVIMSLIFKCPGWEGVFCDPELDEILIAAETELDPDRREELVKEAQIWLLENVGVIPICTNWSVFLQRAELQDVKLSALNRVLLNDATIAP